MLRKPPATAAARSRARSPGSSRTSGITTGCRASGSRASPRSRGRAAAERALRTPRRTSGSTLTCAARWISSPSKVKTFAPSALHSFIAAAAIVSNTGCTSVGDWLITRRMSLVAVCCSSASVRSRLRASSSLNSRTFSMAITAWSANVCSSATARRRNGPGSGRPTAMAPSARPSRSSGTASTLRNPPTRGRLGDHVLGVGQDVRDHADAAGRDRPGRGRVAAWRRGKNLRSIST